MSNFRCLAACVLVGLTLGALTAQAWADDAHPVAQSPAAEAASFRLADPELMVELVAAEPELDSPVAIAWDERGQLFVAEMRDYPLDPRGGAIRRLVDRDGDGRYESSTLFAGDLPFPNGLIAAQGGLFVTAAPDLWFLRDTDDDGVADERRVVLSGFGMGNQQLRANGLTWGLDNWIYGANGRSDGELKLTSTPDAPAVSIRGCDFRLRLDGSAVEAVTGQSQFGQTRDDWGNRFLSWNTIAIRQEMFDRAALVRNPRLAPFAVHSLAAASDRGEVYRASARPQTFNRESTDYYNALCGLHIFRGDALGANYRGDVFVGESLTNLVHHRKLVADGPTFVSERVEQGKEFLAALDPWFHPVFMTTGPDGALYVVDFYRRWVEHPQFVADETARKTVDWREGAGNGRIWRIRHRDHRPAAAWKDGSTQSIDSLVATFESPIGWRRDTAQRLLVERREKAAVEALEAMVRTGSPLAAAHALWTLQGLNAFDEATVAAAVARNNSALQIQILRILRSAVLPTELTQATSDAILVDYSRDGYAAVAFEVALTVASRRDLFAVNEPISNIVWPDLDPWIALAVWSGARSDSTIQLEEFVKRSRTEDLVATLKMAIETTVAKGADNSTRSLREALNRVEGSAGAFTEPTLTITARLAQSIAGGDSPTALAATFKLLRDEQLQPPQRIAVAVGVARGLAERGISWRKQPPELAAVGPSLAVLRKWARETISKASLERADRVMAVELLASAGTVDDTATLRQAMEGDQPTELATAAAGALASLADDQVAGELFDDWTSLSQTVRDALLPAALRAPPLARALVDALEQGRVQPIELAADLRAGLLKLRDHDLVARAEKALARAIPADRQEVLDRYAAALTLAGDTKRGSRVLAQNCSVCHQVQSLGHRVGPDLSGVGARDKQSVLVDILDPSRQVTPGYLSYTAVTTNGQVVTGLLASETPASLSFRRQEGVEEVVRRDQLEELAITGKSLMPEGFEQKLSPQDIADVLQFLSTPDRELLEQAIRDATQR